MMKYIIGERPSDRIVIGLLDSGDLEDALSQSSLKDLKVCIY